MPEENNVATVQPENKEAERLPVPSTKKLIPMNEGQIVLSSLDDLWRFANIIAVSGFAPKGLEKPESIMIAIQHGAEIGLGPMQALQSIAVINGRPSIYGDTALGLVRASGKLEYYTQRLEGKGDDCRAIVKCKRVNDPEPIETSFSVGDAKKAGLWGKQGPWTNYPERMLMWRARGFALRDGFGDVLKGLHIAEESLDVSFDQPAQLPNGRVPHGRKSIAEEKQVEPAKVEAKPEKQPEPKQETKQEEPRKERHDQPHQPTHTPGQKRSNF